MGCSYWVFSHTRKSCDLYDSSERVCTGISGPRFPSLDQCISYTSSTEEVTTTTTASTQTTTTTPLPCDNVTLEVIVKDSQNYNPIPNVVGDIFFNDGNEYLASNVTFGREGNFTVPTWNGQHTVTLSSEGFISTTESFNVFADTSQSCFVTHYVIMSPVLEEGETRLIMSWVTTPPTDVDIHIVAVNKTNSTDSATCMVFFGESVCSEAAIDLDR